LGLNLSRSWIIESYGAAQIARICAIRRSEQAPVSGGDISNRRLWNVLGYSRESCPLAGISESRLEPRGRELSPG